MDRFERALDVCVKKTRRNIVVLAEQPRAYAFAPDGDYFKYGGGFYEIGNWTSSFFTGMALLAYEITRDSFFLKQVNRLAEFYRKKVYEYAMDTMHDLGFLYTLYSVALYKLTGQLEARRTALRAADELAKRFAINGGYIRAWGRTDELELDSAGLAIIDTMMNLPLLFWAARETGNPFYRDIAVRHANTTLARFIRADDSVYHAYRFDPATGAPLGGDNYCGYGVESHWARGTAWAIYGFALAHGYTGEPRYLEAAERLAHKFIECLGGAPVPVWDFRLPPGGGRLRDSSAAAIAVCGLYELGKYRGGGLADSAEAILAGLCREDYLDTDETRPGVLKNGEVAALRDGVGVAENVYTSWGDYFLMEALAKKVHGIEGYW